jgi:hypothetical protein
VDQKRYGVALELLSRAEALAVNPDVFEDRALSKQLKAFVNDTFAYYYYKRGKPSAALVYSEKAMKTHAMQQVNHHTTINHHSPLTITTHHSRPPPLPP